MTARQPLHIVSFVVENRPGVLYKVSCMFRRRAFNIESISVGPTEKRDLARMTITVQGDERTVEQVVKQLSKLVEVVKVSRLDPTASVIREMALVKVHVANSKMRSDLDHYVRTFRARIIDVSPESAVVEITGDSSKIDAFIEIAKVFGIKEVARTGITALIRGPKPLLEKKR
jgi:acetolactate synthase-1/3 small subunit